MSYKYIFGIILILLIGGTLYLIWPEFFIQPRNGSNGQIFCTQDAMLCPDGSYVGRTGPNCEFAACPSEALCEGEACPTSNANLKTIIDEGQGISFQYPDNFSAKYIFPFDWPPQIQIINKPFTCAEAGSETARAGKTEKQIINGQTYCITKITEGAAGSIYTQYAYAFPINSAGSLQKEKTAIFTFSFRFVQCGNYSELEKLECESERGIFGFNNIIDRIARSTRIENTLPETSNSGSPLPEISAKQGIFGTALLGPICPVMQYPPDEKCADKPYATALVLTTADQSRIISEFKSDANGKFNIQTQPGEYAIRSAAAANILPYCASNGNVKVEANKYSEITVYCDTGIR